MKKILVLILLASTSAMADGRVGGPVVHKMVCQSEGMLGVGYSLEVTTQALAPQYSTRGITLISKVVYPGAQPKRHQLVQVSQNASRAIFGDDGVRVVLDKRNFTAGIYFGSELAFSCAAHD